MDRRLGDVVFVGLSRWQTIHQCIDGAEKFLCKRPLKLLSCRLAPGRGMQLLLRRELQVTS